MAEPFLSALIFKHMSWGGLFNIALKKFTVMRRLEDMPPVHTGVFFSFPEWTGRKDYLEICDYVTGQVSDKFFFRLSALRWKFVWNARHLRRAISKCRTLPGLSVLEKVFMTGVVYNSLVMIDAAERSLNIDAEKYVSFSCVLGIEHLLTQYFRKRGVPTYNLQHGVTFLYNKNPQDRLEYTNMIADYHLAWGDYSRNEMIRYGLDSRRVVAAGYPRRQEYMPVSRPRTHHCIVFLSRQHFNKDNLDCLEVLNEYRQHSPVKLCFHIKLHPSLDTRAYRRWIKANCDDDSMQLLPDDMTLQNILNHMQPGFCVVVNSSAYYECYMHGVVALRYFATDFDIEYPIADDLFSTNAEFSRLMQAMYGSFDKHFHPDKIRRELQYVLGLPGNEYGRILNTHAVSL
jgi:hypothetical protein